MMDDEYECYKCGIKFKLPLNWQINNVTFIDGIEVFVCDKCGGNNK